jgi:ankyrin repeat protein
MTRSAVLGLIVASVWVTTPLSLCGGPLHDAAQKGDVPAIKTLLAQGADVNAKDEQGATPLLYATLKGQKATADFLLNNGAKADIGTGQGMTPLLLAARYGEAEIASLLVAKGAKLDGRLPDGKTPLHLSVRYGFLEIVRVLVEHGAKVDMTDNEGWTPLIFAAALGNLPIVDYLLSKGANANLADKSDKPPRTALGMAAWNRYQDETKYKPVIKLLLAHGAKDNWLSAVPGFDPYAVSGLMLKQGADGRVMSGSMPFFLGGHTAIRPWKDPGASAGSKSGTNCFVWETPPSGDRSTVLVAINDQMGNQTAAAAVLPAFIGEGGIIYNDGISTIAKDGPFAKLAIVWQDGSNHPVSGGRILVTRPSGTIDLTTDTQGAATSLLRHVTRNEPITVAFNSGDSTSRKTEFDCVIRGASETTVQFVIRKTK